MYREKRLEKQIVIVTNDKYGMSLNFNSYSWLIENYNVWQIMMK